MMRDTIIRLRFGQLMLFVGLAGAPSLQAQDTCDAVVARATNEFDTARRLQLLVAAVDPTTCRSSSVWPLAVQLLAQTLIEDGRDSLAVVWLRWAVRLAPDLQPDTVQFLPRVVATFRNARDFVFRSAARGDTATSTTWQWPARITNEPTGRLQVTPSPATDAVRVFAEGGGLIGPGGSISVTPGSYAVSVSAPGYDSLRVTREVLPGVTTMLNVRIRPALALQPAPPAPAPAPQRKKKFPVVWVAAGAVALGAVALLAGGGKSPTTGGISITFPNP